MKTEIDGDRLTIETGPGARQAALDNVAAYFSQREAQKTRRLLIVAATAFAIVAAVTVVFVPAGRESWAPWIGAPLAVLAAGAAGYSRFWLTTPLLKLRAARDETTEEDPS